jgi:hypothetical protein
MQNGLLYSELGYILVIDRIDMEIKSLPDWKGGFSFWYRTMLSVRYF